ncbi:hypothetical protein EYF80_018177 [Liparis tanakae]|uniref:Uncharacterized protein n=1 Tax=Liparis tanakae TaxID=230148 RepID=A0A4Z2I320_9TELE|nr:hypothetical protein EYF80_018177 [Liparis tanakae]
MAFLQHAAVLRPRVETRTAAESTAEPTCLCPAVPAVTSQRSVAEPEAAASSRAESQLSHRVAAKKTDSLKLHSQSTEDLKSIFRLAPDSFHYLRIENAEEYSQRRPRRCQLTREAQSLKLGGDAAFHFQLASVQHADLREQSALHGEGG